MWPSQGKFFRKFVFLFFSSFLHLDFLSNQTEDITLASEILNQPSIKILGNEKPHQRKNKQTAINPKIKQSKKKNISPKRIKNRNPEKESTNPIQRNRSPITPTTILTQTKKIARKKPPKNPDEKSNPKTKKI